MVKKAGEVREADNGAAEADNGIRRVKGNKAAKHST
jgi:hypothetical protein